MTSTLRGERREQWDAVLAERERHRNRVRELFEQGRSDEEIAAIVTVEGRETGARGVKALRLKMKLKHPRYDLNAGLVPLDTAYVEREFRERNPETDEDIRNVILGIATDVDRHPDHIRRHLREAGFIEAKPKRADPEKLEQARRLVEDGASYHEAEKTTGLSRHTIRDHFPGLGVRPEDQWVYIQAKKLEAAVGL